MDIEYLEELWNASSVGDLDTVKNLVTPQNIEGTAYFYYYSLFVKEAIQMNSERRVSLQVTSFLMPQLTFVACEFGHLEVVKFLVSQGANIEALRGTGSTPLFVASSNG
jgi:hypothetical protein